MKIDLNFRTLNSIHYALSSQLAMPLNLSLKPRVIQMTTNIYVKTGRRFPSLVSPAAGHSGHGKHTLETETLNKRYAKKFIKIFQIPIKTCSVQVAIGKTPTSFANFLRGCQNCRSSECETRISQDFLFRNISLLNSLISPVCQADACK